MNKLIQLSKEKPRLPLCKGSFLNTTESSTDMKKPGFTLHMKSNALFFFNQPNIGFSGGDINSHTPTYIERKLDDLGVKYALMNRAHDKILELTRNIRSNYDVEKNALKVDQDYWDLVLFLNHLLFEARSMLDVLALLLAKLYQGKLPQSFNAIAIDGKHKDIFQKDLNFQQCLLDAIRADWTSYLLSPSKGQPSLRDRAAHYTAARIKIEPAAEIEELIFSIVASTNAVHPMSIPHGSDLLDTVGTIKNGVDNLLLGFKKNYTQIRIRELLGVEVNGPGLFPSSQD